MVVGHLEWGGEVPQGAAVLLPAEKLHLLSVSAVEPAALWKVSFIRGTDFHFDSLLLREYSGEHF